MARSITSCTGEVFTIGQKIKTPDGNVITMQGGAVGVKFYNAEKCTAAGPHDKPHANAAPQNNDTDCVVWGS
jgi:hypothetical protein